MGIGKFFGVGKEISEPVEAIGNSLDKLFTSDEERLTKQDVIERTKQNPTLWQHTIDLINAKSSTPAVQFARPFCVYIAGLNAFQLGVAVVWFGKNTIPEWYITMTTTGFLGALGIYGAMRSIEKLAGKIK